jgi:hypothetical protein
MYFPTPTALKHYTQYLVFNHGSDITWDHEKFAALGAHRHPKSVTPPDSQKPFHEYYLYAFPGQTPIGFLSHILSLPAGSDARASYDRYDAVDLQCLGVDEADYAKIPFDPATRLYKLPLRSHVRPHFMILDGGRKIHQFCQTSWLS